ncbi:MAG: hypothetical protein Q8M98_00110 [Candidatus Cloacimonadaceae bacterium]|nr:hypothetical protein [Candidatus Cloacimonadaceae bacterium]MDP3113154.1 hypothetical protein [Candidatus Cloacimonadaceae bacterium]
MDNRQYDTYQAGNSPRVHRHHGGWILLLGILGFFSLGIVGIFAWVWGNSDLQKMNAGLMDEAGTDFTEYGRILGIISLFMWIIGIAIYFIVHTVSPGIAG